jgi:hypothetical protein
MMTSSQAPSAAYQSCVDEVLRQSPFLIDRWCSKLMDAMYERSIIFFDPAERHQIQNAIAALKKNRALIEQRFPEALKKAIADDAAAAGTDRKSVHPARSLSTVSFDELELMGDNQVQEAVESARLQQLIRLTCEAGLAGFSARLSTAQGFLVVKADSNPLRPEVMALALFRLLQTLPVTSQARACWLLDGAQLMGEELQSLYVLLNDFLASQGIAPAAYGVIATPENKGARTFRRERSDSFQVSQVDSFTAGSEPAPFVAEEESNRSSRKQLLTLDHLHHLLVGDYDNSASESASFSSFSDYGTKEVVHNEFSHTLPAALDVLTELEEKGLATTREKAARFAPSQPVAQLRAHLRTDAKSLGQSLAIEVVGLMIEQMANDERLLKPVRQVIANSEPAFLRLAVTDPRFFSDKSHPARKLLETITSTSLGYASEDAPGFSEFMQGLKEVAVLLTEEHASDAQHFTELLDDFERKQTRYTPESRQAQRRAVQALLQAEQRNMLAVKISAEIRARPDFVEGNRIITAFLTGPWAQVMAKERLLGEYGGEGSTQAVFSLTLGDVLWSLDMAQAASHRKRLLKIIPDMLKSLREGLLSIDYPLEKSRSFFDELMAIHQAGLRAQPGIPATVPKSSHTMEKMFESDDEPDSAQPWLAPTEAQHSGFMEDWDGPSIAGLGSNPLWPQDNASPAGTAQSGLGESIELNLGDWVDMLVDMQWLRAQLTWVSPHNTLFMFTSEGGRKHSMTSRVLRHLLELNLVKVVSQQGVLDGALDSVARTAMRNSVQGEGNY